MTVAGLQDDIGQLMVDYLLRQLTAIHSFPCGMFRRTGPIEYSQPDRPVNPFFRRKSRSRLRETIRNRDRAGAVAANKNPGWGGEGDRAASLAVFYRRRIVLCWWR